MSTPQSILVATDFSEHAEQAVTQAIALARQGGLRLHVAHVFAPPIPIVAPYDVPPPDLYLNEARKRASDELARCQDRARAAGVEAQTDLLSGPAAQAISELAKTLDVDLVVVGTRGLTGLKHVMLGSVAESVVRHAPCNVLVVRAEDTHDG